MLTHFDFLLDPNGPVALAIEEHLQPAAGDVIFPPTFAPEEGSKDGPSYVIDQGVALIDSVGSQANRLEPIFKTPPYDKLVPQVVVSIGERKVNLLDAGHRAADAIVRFSDRWSDLRNAFLAIRENGNAEPLARIAPTSLVFGAWDSRDTQAKLPRLVESTIRARGVTPLRRAAQYISSIEEDYRAEQELGASKLGKDFPAAVGLVDNPSGRVHGGVIASNGIRRDALLNLVALRALAAENPEATRKLQRYILGLALVAFYSPNNLFLRQGCLLTGVPEKPASAVAVHRSGQREDFSKSHDEISQFAQAAAQDFGVGPNLNPTFNPDEVKKAAKEKKAK
jgi:CRISPR-associated protein Csb1